MNSAGSVAVALSKLAAGPYTLFVTAQRNPSLSGLVLGYVGTWLWMVAFAASFILVL